MRISDWSSDVCSSDLRRGRETAVGRRRRARDLNRDVGHAQLRPSRDRRRLRRAVDAGVQADRRKPAGAGGLIGVSARKAPFALRILRRVLLPAIVAGVLSNLAVYHMLGAEGALTDWKSTGVMAAIALVGLLTGGWIALRIAERLDRKSTRLNYRH